MLIYKGYLTSLNSLYMSDNLSLTMCLEDVQKLLKNTTVPASEYCVLYDSVPSHTLVITTNEGFRLLLVKEYGASEVSDWYFNEQYVSSKERKNYTIIGNKTLVDNRSCLY